MGPFVLQIKYPMVDGSYILRQIIDIQDYRDVPSKELESPFVIPKDDRTCMILIQHCSI
jgi:hypothetical protein